MKARRASRVVDVVSIVGAVATGVAAGASILATGRGQGQFAVGVVLPVASILIATAVGLLANRVPRSSVSLELAKDALQHLLLEVASASRSKPKDLAAYVFLTERRLFGRRRLVRALQEGLGFDTSSRNREEAHALAEYAISDRVRVWAAVGETEPGLTEPVAISRGWALSIPIFGRDFSRVVGALVLTSSDQVSEERERPRHLVERLAEYTAAILAEVVAPR